jgi:hypothetical protein
VEPKQEERNVMRQELTFATREEGIKLLDAMSDILTRSGFVSVADLKGLTAMCGEIYKDQTLGWMSLDGVETFSHVDGKKFVVRFPEPKNRFEGLSPQEINFITHPFLRQLVEEIEKDPNLTYTITQDDKPIAVVISPIAHERALLQLKALSELGAVVNERNGHE